MDLTEYFVKHYSEVIDNDESTYREATRAAVGVVRGSDITRSEWLALSGKERETRFADEIGSAIMDLITEWCEELDDLSGPAALLVREIMIFSSSDIAYGLGCHFMPEDAEVADLLDDDTEDDAS